MNLVFHTIRWRNFLSTGNAMTEISLDRTPNTLIIGENGAGKSTCLDAITFALYGKPYRKINKPQLVNSINGKQLEVEIEFTVGSQQYLVRRGIKPAIFEIWSNNKQIEPPDKTVDHQTFFEKNILRINFKSFTQIVVLGTKFIPFMQLKSKERREVIEDLLDISIFSSMNTLLRDKISNNKNGIVLTTAAIEGLNDKIRIRQQHIDHLTRSKDDLIEKNCQQIAQLLAQRHELLEEERTILDQLHELSQGLEEDQEKLTIQSQELVNFKMSTLESQKIARKNVQFFANTSSCPTCTQDIGSDFRDNTIEINTTKIERTQQALDLAEDRINKLNAQMADLIKRQNQITDIQIRCREIHASATQIWNTVQQLEKTNSELEDDKNSMEDLTAEMNSFKRQLGKKVRLKETLIHEREIFDVAATLLKDKGIKTQIVKQYVPIINTLVNKYLQAMNFFVNFTLDENFNETIKSRHRDVFSYDSFSEGEKARIDLALLLTWRAIAKIKNSMNTNLLVLDEVFDSSLDAEGGDDFMKLIYDLGQESNVFVISHTQGLVDKFYSTIRFEKVKNFSQMVD